MSRSLRHFDYVIMKETAMTLTELLLKQANIPLVIIGCHALHLLGSYRDSVVVDVLVNCDEEEAKEAIMGRDARFRLVDPRMRLSDFRLRFRSSEYREVLIETYGDGGKGPNAVLTLPDVTAVPILTIDSIPVLHPSKLICIKLYRWKNLPAPMFQHRLWKGEREKKKNDVDDIFFLLRWLVQHNSKMWSQDLDTQHKELLTKAINKFIYYEPGSEQLFAQVVSW